MKLSVFLVFTSLLLSFNAQAQIGSPYEPGVGQAKRTVYKELEPIDITHGKNQRTDVKRLFLTLGYNLKTDESDLDVMQRLLDLRRVRRDDIATQQAMGLVLGDIFAKKLDMDWIVVKDDKCLKSRLRCSRALRYRDSNVVIYPVTMISRRYKSGVDVNVKSLYNKILNSTRKKISDLHRYG